MKRKKLRTQIVTVAIIIALLLPSNNVYAATHSSSNCTATHTSIHLSSSTSTEARKNIIDAANHYDGWCAGCFNSCFGSGSVTGPWCAWFIKKAATDAGVSHLFSRRSEDSDNVNSMFLKMTNPNGAYKAQGYVVTDTNTNYLNARKNGEYIYKYAKEVTSSTFTPETGDLVFIQDSSSSTGMSHVAFVWYVTSSRVYIIDGNGGTGTWQTRPVRGSSESKWWSRNAKGTNYAISAYIKPNYESLDSNLPPTVTLPAAMTSTTSAEAKTNIINYALSLVGYNRTTFTNAGCSDIPSGDWCTWFLKLCGKQVGINDMFSPSTSVSAFCTDMIQNYGAQAFYYTDSSFLTAVDKAALNGAQAVTKATFTPQKGDIYILHESGFSDMSQVGLVADVVNGSVYAVVGNNGTAQEVQYRNSTTNTFYQLTNSICPIIGVIRPNYTSLDAHTCSGTAVAAKEATCTEAGNVAYYTCSCGKWYSDSACMKQITDKSSVIIAALGHSWQEATCTTPKTCTTCKTTSGSALGHSYGSVATYVDYTSHSYTCTRNCGEIKIERHSDNSCTRSCDICHGSTVDPAKAGLQVTLQNPDTEYIYTGSAIKPAIVVTQDGEILTAGVDYTVKFSNNVNASLNKSEMSKPRITVTGKGNLTGSSYTTFDIQPKDIAEADVLAGDLIVETNTKALPVLTYNSRKLTAGDYTVENAQKKYTENGIVKITGKGNFKGTRTISVNVVQKEELKRFTVVLGQEKLIYNGKEQRQSYSVLDAKTKTLLKENIDYMVVYPSNTINAGTVAFSVIGIGKYTGTVTKSYTINPLAVKSGMSYSGLNEEGYPYVAKGATVGADLVVSYNNGTSTIVLTEGKDYRISYSNNRQVSTAGANAKFTVSFIGNYRGSTALKGSFRVYASGLSDATPGLKIALADMTYTGKAGCYKSVPFVTINGVALKASDYIAEYYRDADLTQEIKGNLNNIVLQEGETSATIYVKIIGKGNYAPKAGVSSYATASYKVFSKVNQIDLSKARITFLDVSGKKLTKTEYTGRAVCPKVKVEVKVGKQYIEVPSDQYKVTYVNNVKKGKATAIVNGTGKQYVGSKRAQFTIASMNIKNVRDLWRNLYK